MAMRKVGCSGIPMAGQWRAGGWGWLCTARKSETSSLWKEDKIDTSEIKGKGEGEGAYSVHPGH